MRRALGPINPLVAIALNNLGGVYGELRDYARAEQFYARALARSEQARGPDNPDVPVFLNNLGTTKQARGQHAAALRLFERALTLQQKLAGPDQPDLAITLNNSATSKIALGQYESAAALLRRVLAITERTTGARHPQAATALNNLAALAVVRNQTDEAVRLLTRAAEIREYNLALIIVAGAEEQKRRYMATLADETDFTIWLHLHRAPDNAAATRLAFTTLLRRKGRVLDVLSQQAERLRRTLPPTEQPLLAQLAAARARLSALVFGRSDLSAPPAQTTTAQQLETEVARLEIALGARSTEFRTTNQPVTLIQVQAALPPDAALIEFVRYRPFAPLARRKSEKYGAPHYAAYVLRPTGAPQAVELGRPQQLKRP